jgi:ADP-ribose pyrophosphatase
MDKTRRERVRFSRRERSARKFAFNARRTRAISSCPFPMKDHQLKPWQVLDSREVFQASPWIRVSRQKVRLPDGRVVDDYHQIRLSDFALVVASTNDGRILVERQYRHGLGQVTLLLPAGTLGDGEDPLIAAQRELLEETGYVSDDWRLLGRFTASASYGCGTMSLFTARNIRKVSTPDSGDLEEMEIMFLSVNELFAAIREGKMPALSSAAAVALAMHPTIFPPISPQKP